MKPGLNISNYLERNFRQAERVQFYIGILAQGSAFEAVAAEKASILLNKEAIAINQDALAHAADRLRNDSATGEQLWARPLANGDRAVLLFHR
jgi:hypothetical protein